MKQRIFFGILVTVLAVGISRPLVLSQNSSSVITWENVNAWVYQLQNFNVKEISNANSELAVIDYSYDGTEDNELPRNDVLAMKSGKHPKKLISYMSIGEAEDYRFYWKDEWNTNPPSWLGPENPNWPGNYKVRYWDPEWQRIIYGTPDSYLDRIIRAGFDGVYLDIIDAYDFFEEERPSAKEDMIRFVISIAQYARNLTDASFGVFPQNAEELLTDSRYLSVITGLGREEVYYIATNEPRSAEEVARIEEKLDILVRNNKLALIVDYATKSNLVVDAYEHAQEKGYIPYVTEVELNKLTPTYNDFLEGNIQTSNAGSDFFLGTTAVETWLVTGIVVSSICSLRLVTLRRKK